MYICKISVQKYNRSEKIDQFDKNINKKFCEAVIVI
jgi:hypothetical protein